MMHYFQEHGHRVRLATHANFKDFVLSTGLEFFPLGGDAKVLADCKCSDYFLFFFASHSQTKVINTSIVVKNEC